MYDASDGAVKTTKGLATVSPEAPPNPARIIEDELREVEAKLLTQLESGESMIAEICHYLIEGGGKRTRPTFMLLVYRACGGSDARVRDAIDVSVALELIHSATLLHDDIIDTGRLRRGKPSAYSRFGLAPSLIAGDYLFSRAFEVCGRFDESLIRLAARACIQLTEGELMESRFRHNPKVTIDDYMAVIDRKTASLFWSGARIAAQVARAPQKVIDLAGELGVAVGRAFQMADDMLDVIGPESKIGKPVGSDLRAGIPSLPVVLAVDRVPELRLLFQSGSGIDGAGFDRALELVRASEVMGEARATAARQAASAHRVLAKFKQSIYRDQLAALIDEQLGREV